MASPFSQRRLARVSIMWPVSGHCVGILGSKGSWGAWGACLAAKGYLRFVVVKFDTHLVILSGHNVICKHSAAHHCKAPIGGVVVGSRDVVVGNNELHCHKLTPTGFVMCTTTIVCKLRFFLAKIHCKHVSSCEFVTTTQNNHLKIVMGVAINSMQTYS